MDALAKGGVFLFGGFRLDRQARALFRRDEGGVFVPVAVGSRALDVLGVLVGRAGDLVSRDEFMAAVWPVTVVGDINLNMQIAALRRVLDARRADGSCIQTSPGRGYRFVGRVTREVVDARANTVLRPIAPRLSLVVLPFTNLSSDPDQQYFADGITEDLTTDLSRTADMLVISRNTAFTYQGKRIDTKQIGRELGVRYVLEGSVQRSGNRVRVSAQLIDAETDTHLWAERFDADTADLFELQDEVTSRIANTLGVELIAKEAARETHHPDALDFILRGRAERLKPLRRESVDAAIDLFRRALALDPGSAEAQCRLAMALVSRQMDFGSDSAGSDIQQAEALTLRALATAPRNALAHFARGGVLRVQARHDEAIAEYEAALASNPNMVRALADLGRCKIYLGPIDEAITAQLQAIRLSPRDPAIGLWYFRTGQAHLVQSRFDEAIPWLEKARSVEPGIPFIRAFLAAAYALIGDTEKAAAQLGEAQRLDGKCSFSSIARLKLMGSINQNRGARPEIRELFEATYYAGLRKAGMLEK
jgi:TolB-like protein/Flp pilus assembly protein TadD